MRVLAATWDMPGHFNPLVPLCWALRAAGHEVVVVSNPGLTPAITQSGLTALPAGSPSFDSFAALREQLAARSWRPVPPPTTAGDDGDKTRRRRLHGFRTAADSALAQADDVVAFAGKWRPDLVLFEPVAFVGPLVGKLCGVPAVRVLWSVDFTAPMAEFEQDVVGELLDRFDLAELGVNGDLTLDPCPPALQYDLDLPRRRFRFVPYNGACVLPGELAPPRDGRPRVCLTWGTSQERLGFAHMMLAPRVVAALAEAPVEVVVAVTDTQRPAFGDLPANVVAIGRMPLDALLRDCDVLVQQGGAGGTMTALINGVPQLVVPHMPDEIFHGRQVEQGGVGRCLPGAEASEQALREHVMALLEEPGYRATARRLREEMLAQPSPAQLLPELERLASTGPRASLERAFLPSHV